MVISKKRITHLSEYLIFVFLLSFPFGQLLKINLDIFGLPIGVHLIDVVASSSIILILFGQYKYPEYFKYFKAFILVSLFSLMFSLTLFSLPEVIRGSLYFIRLIIYSSFSVIVWNIIKDNTKKKLLLNSLILVSIFVAIFGWIQYLNFPDLRGLLYLGWDNHLFRLVGTFFDPGFTSIILALGTLTAFAKYLYEKDKKLVIIVVFLLITLLFTYARASYVALIGGVLGLFLIKGRKKISLWPILLVLLIIPFLPRPGGEGVKLERFQSIYNKYGNYKQTIQVIGKYPLFGVGYNNLCSARIGLFENEAFKSHACSGSDSSILLIIATTGIVGLLIFTDFAIKLIKNININDFYGVLFISGGIAVFIHSLFVNSMFYPWVMGYLGITLALTKTIKNT